MSKMLSALAVSSALALGGCVTLDEVIKTVIADAKVACSVVVDANMLLQALKDLDPNVLNAGNIAASICRQVVAMEQQQPASASATTKTLTLTAPKYTVTINGHPVTATPVLK